MDCNLSVVEILRRFVLKIKAERFKLSMFHCYFMVVFAVISFLLFLWIKALLIDANEMCWRCSFQFSKNSVAHANRKAESRVTKSAIALRSGFLIAWLPYAVFSLYNLIMRTTLVRVCSFTDFLFDNGNCVGHESKF